MGTNHLNKVVSQTQNIPPIPTPGPLKSTDEVNRSHRMNIKSSEDRKEADVTISEIEGLTIELNGFMEDLQTNLRFSLHDEIENQVIVQIKNKETDELIRQFPPEELLKIREKMIDLAGVLFDQRV